MRARTSSAAGVAFLAVMLGALVGVARVHAAPRGGLYGVARRGPVTPVCRVGIPCVAPAGGLELTFSPAGGPTYHVTTTAVGRYRISLPPGRYSVTRAAPSVGPGGRLTPVVVRVPPTGWKRVDFSLDTGIR